MRRGTRQLCRQVSGFLIGVLVSLVALAGTTSTAAAETNIYDWKGDDAPALIENETGIFFLGNDKQPRRVYSWDRAEGENTPAVVMPDADDDGSYEVLGAGTPTFMVAGNSDPMWSRSDGCDQVLVADFAADGKLDVFCLNGGQISVYTYDNQRIFQADMGAPIEYCRGGDLNGDLKIDLECKYVRSDKWMRLDVNASNIIVQESEETKIREGGQIDIDEASPVGDGILSGDQKNYDFNGDGVAEEGLKADGNAVVLQSKSKKKALARIDVGGEPKAALAKNLDGDGPMEIVVVTDDDIVVIDAKAHETIGTYSADADDYSRHPVADLTSTYAQKFSDTGKAEKVVKDAKPKLAECYASRARGNLFVRIGRVAMKVNVDKKGEVSVDRNYSELRDKEVESCAREVLADLEYPEVSGDLGEGETATINVEVKYTFADQPK